MAKKKHSGNTPLNKELTDKFSNDELNNCINVWKGYREDLVTQKLELEKQIDKTVFAISSGALGISLAFIDKLSPAAEYNYFYWILGSGWCCLVFTIILQTMSFVNTAKQIKGSISKVEETIDSETSEILSKREEEFYQYWGEQNSRIDKRNKFSFNTMISGVFIILVFAFLSLFTKENKDKASEQINIFLTDSLINKQFNMSNDKKNQNPAKDSSSKSKSEKFNDQSSGKSQQRGQLDSGKQNQQIKNPPIKTQPPTKKDNK